MRLFFIILKYDLLLHFKKAQSILVEEFLEYIARAFDKGKSLFENKNESVHLISKNKNIKKC